MNTQIFKIYNEMTELRWFILMTLTTIFISTISALWILLRLDPFTIESALFAFSGWLSCGSAAWYGTKMVQTENKPLVLAGHMVLLFGVFVISWSAVIWFGNFSGLIIL